MPRNAGAASYEITDSFVVPEARYGNHHVQFWRFTRDDAVGFQFAVRPRLEVSPAQAEPGARITLKCTGFPTSAGGTITFDGKPTDIQITPNARGTFTTEFTVPNTLAGDHKFVASSPQVFTDVLAAMVRVTPVITVEPRQPEIGAEVKVTGHGFAARSPVKIKYDNIAVASSPNTDDNGSFTYSFKVPESSAKEHTITVEDGAGNRRVWGMTLEGKPPPKPATVAPKNERFGWLGDQTVTFAWTPVTDESGVTYTIEVAEDLRFFPLKPGMKKTGLTQPNTTIAMKPGAYYWRVRAVDGVGNEGEWAVSPFAFNVGFFATWMLAAAGVICLLIFILLIRAFFRRLREYY